MSRRVLLFLFLVVPTLLALTWGAGLLLSAPSRAVVNVPSRLGAEAVQFKSDSGALLHGSWIAGAAQAPVVVLMHGVRADRRALFGRAEFLKSLGYAVLLFDFQAHGESAGEQITFGYLESRDAQAAVQYARQRMPSVPLGVIGISLGGAAALLGQVRADALILEAAFPDIRTATDNRVKRWLGPLSGVITPLFMELLKIELHINENDLRPVEQISAFKGAVLILSGSKDVHTTVKDTEALFSAANEPKKMFLFKGARHQDLYAFDPRTYEDLVRPFLRERLVRASAQK